MTRKPADLALNIAANIHKIARHPAAGRCYAEVKAAIDDIERMINRPLPPLELGPCQTLLEDNTKCTAGLIAKRGEIEITCWKCKTTYNVSKMIEDRLTDVPNRMFIAREVLQVMGQIGEPIGDSTWRRWRAQSKIEPCGELYGEPAYRLADVRALRRKYARNNGVS